MGWQNPYALGNEAMGCNCSYSCSSHGSASATYDAIINADLPSYAHGFYSQTEFEALSELKYSKTEIGYDKDLREIKRAIDGAPLEAYVPSGHPMVDDSGSAIPKTGGIIEQPIEPIVIKSPDKRVVDEILKAQMAVTGKEIILREIEIEEIVIKRRRIRKREIILKKSKHSSLKYEE